MDVCLLCLYVVLSCVGRGLCDGLIIRPEECYRVSNSVRLRNLRSRRPRPDLGCTAIGWMDGIEQMLHDMWSRTAQAYIQHERRKQEISREFWLITSQSEIILKLEVLTRGHNIRGMRIMERLSELGYWLSWWRCRAVAFNTRERCEERNKYKLLKQGPVQQRVWVSEWGRERAGEWTS
jgi:hypothetical protein